MNYEVVEIKEKKVVGLNARTSNSDPNVGVVIGSMWNKMFSDGIYQKIECKDSGKTFGIYSDYSGDDMNEYMVTVGCDVTDTANIPDGTSVVTIPAGKYARFEVKGHMQTAVAEFWSNLWSINLDRTFVADFEEYQDAEMENATIHIYIGIK